MLLIHQNYSTAGRKSQSERIEIWQASAYGRIPGIDGDWIWIFSIWINRQNERRSAPVILVISIQIQMPDPDETGAARA